MDSDEEEDDMQVMQVHPQQEEEEEGDEGGNHPEEEEEDHHRNVQEEEEDEDEEEEDAPHPPPEDEGGLRRHDDGSIDGGVALDVPKTAASDCDLMITLECAESLPSAPDHPLLQPGTKVTIGLDKTTKLSSVFQRYLKFLQETSDTGEADHRVPTLQQVEFVHSSLLNGNDTAEAAALMKHDVVRVRPSQHTQRQHQQEVDRLQRELDRDYFKQLQMHHNQRDCDLYLECLGLLLDDEGRNQQVLQTGLRAHSCLLEKRCPWLGDLITRARQELQRNSVVTVDHLPEEDEEDAANQRDDDDDDDDPMGRVAEGRGRGDDEINPPPQQQQRVQIESDDHEEEESPNDPNPSNKKKDAPPLPDPSSLLWVTLHNHSPDAVRILLEYCYTNRVESLGQDAFQMAQKTKSGAVAPYHKNSSRSRGWPAQGKPTISFSVSMAGLALAEEARLPRLSLMCEVAACQLVDASTVLQALTLCTTHQNTHANPLPLLRKAAMEQLLSHGRRGVTELSRAPSFARTIREKSALVVPSLLVGTMEAVQAETLKPTLTAHLHGKRHKSSSSSSHKNKFDDLDRADVKQRRLERRKWRAERAKSLQQQQHQGVVSIWEASHNTEGGYSKNRRKSASRKRHSDSLS